MIANLDLYIAIAVTAITVGFPIFYGMSQKVKAAEAAAAKQGLDTNQQILAGVNAALLYLQQNPTQDKALENLIITIAKAVGIAIPASLE